VRNVVPEATVEARYDAINEFEAELVSGGTTVVKCFLHISKDEQLERLQARLDDPKKHWKFSPGDVDDRRLWEEYQRCYEIAIERCNTEAAPWFVVPADRKWYRNWAVTNLLREHLGQMDLQWPQADFDVDEQRRRLQRS
jgi:polyphosphate kinase 2 (PPK2 family)